MFIIYKITNLINQVSYVGQTTLTKEQRWAKHRSSGSGCKRLKNAIDYYGYENFIIEQIDTAQAQEEADNKEEYWIKELKTLVPNGYNILEGGQNRSLLKMRESLVNYYKTHKYKESRRKPGESNPAAKLTEEKVRIIRWLIKYSNVSVQEISEIFEISLSAVDNIKYNKSWKHIAIPNINEFSHQEIEKNVDKKIYGKPGIRATSSRNGNSKLTEEKVIEIKKLLATNQYTSVQIGKMIGISGDAVRSIKKGITWSYIEI